MICHGMNVVLVKCTTQKVVALSSAESEYYAMCRTATQAEFVKGIVFFWLKKLKAVELHVDASAAKAMAERKGVGRTRHVQARFLWLQDKVSDQDIFVRKLAGEKNVADMVTKVMPAVRLHQLMGAMGFEVSDRKGHLRAAM